MDALSGTNTAFAGPVTVVADDGYYDGYDETAPDAASASGASSKPNGVAAAGSRGSRTTSPSSSE